MLFLLLLAIAFAGSARAQTPSTTPGPRRSLPKPPTGTRGFEKYTGGDTSKRGIEAGATRETVNPRRPVAPLAGRAYDVRPLFAWETAPGSKTYHFIIYEGDFDKDRSARVVFQADVTVTELLYPKNGPRLEPGKVYSWMVSTPTATGKEDGPLAVFDILTGQEAAEVKQALATAGLTAPKTAADRLDQAQVFANFGIWYDALRIASELAQNPNDKAALAYYDELLDKLDAKQEP
jgi:hypothetical protein